MKPRIRHLSGAALFAAALFVIAASADSTSAAPYGRLDISGSYGEYVTQAKNYHITSGQWTAVGEGGLNDKPPANIRLSIDNAPYQNARDWSLYIVTRSGIEVGTYNVGSGIIETIYFTAGGRGNSALVGTFRVDEVEWTNDLIRYHISRLSLTFDFTEQGPTGPQKLSGTLLFRDDSSPILGSYPSISRAKYSKSQGALTIKGVEFEQGATVAIDGTELSTGAQIRQRSIKIKGVTLPPGIHTVVVKNPDNGETSPFQFPVFSSFQFDAPITEPDEPDSGDADQ